MISYLGVSIWVIFYTLTSTPVWSQLWSCMKLNQHRVDFIQNWDSPNPYKILWRFYLSTLFCGMTTFFEHRYVNVDLCPISTFENTLFSKTRPDFCWLTLNRQIIVQQILLFFWEKNTFTTLLGPTRLLISEIFP